MEAIFSDGVDQQGRHHRTLPLPAGWPRCELVCEDLPTLPLPRILPPLYDVSYPRPTPYPTAPLPRILPLPYSVSFWLPHPNQSRILLLPPTLLKNLHTLMNLKANHEMGRSRNVCTIYRAFIISKYSVAIPFLRGQSFRSVALLTVVCLILWSLIEEPTVKISKILI